MAVMMSAHEGSMFFQGSCAQLAQYVCSTLSKDWQQKFKRYIHFSGSLKVLSELYIIEHFRTGGMEEVL